MANGIESFAEILAIQNRAKKSIIIQSFFFTKKNAKNRLKRVLNLF